jgi:hypothetical protein
MYTYLVKNHILEVPDNFLWQWRKMAKIHQISLDMRLEHRHSSGEFGFKFPHGNQISGGEQTA